MSIEANNDAIYRKKGYQDRNDYLAQLADEYGVELQTVEALAELLGPIEDFDGLVTALQDQTAFPIY